MARAAIRSTSAIIWPMRGSCFSGSGPARSRATLSSASASSYFPWPRRAFARLKCRGGVIALEPDHLSELRFRPRVVMHRVAQGRAQAESGRDEVGLEPDRLAVGRDRLIQLPLARQGDAEVVVGCGIVGLEADRLAELGLGGRIVPLHVTEGAAEAVVDLGVIGLGADGLAIGRDRLVGLALASEGIAEFMMRMRVVGRELDRRAVFRDGFLGLPLV